MVGRTLELMLKGVGYDAQFLNGSFIERPAELPEEVQLVILMPGLRPEGREGFLEGMESVAASATATGKIRVLELVTGSDRSRADREGYVPWPCRIENLKRKIEAALQTSSLAS